MVTFLIAASILDLRQAFQKFKQPPKWAIRITRPMTPGWLVAIMNGDEKFYDMLFSILRGSSASGQGVVYGLFSHSMLYVGKASITRQTSHTGVVDRVMEHVRLLRRPKMRDGMKPRYKQLRMTPWILRFSTMLIYIWTPWSIFFSYFSYIWAVRSIFSGMLRYIWTARSI